MDHKGDVVVYQVQKDKSSCCCHVPLNFEPVEVTRNLLQNEDCTFKVVSPRLFKPWHGECLAQMCDSGIHTIVVFLHTQSYVEPFEFKMKEIFPATRKLYLRNRNWGEILVNATVVVIRCCYFYFTDIKTLIPLVFKFQPPKLSLDTLQTLKQSSIVNNETPLGQALDLMVFSPGYSGKLCFKLQPGKYSASKYECNNRLTSCRPGNDSWPRSVAVMDDMVEINKSEEQGFNSSSKSVSELLLYSLLLERRLRFAALFLIHVSLFFFWK